MVNPENKMKLDRKKRGQISSEELELYIEFGVEHLIKMLDADDPQERTAAATILGNKRDKKGIMPLCASLERKSALFTNCHVRSVGQNGKYSSSATNQITGPNWK
jgi:hypothetical protein